MSEEGCSRERERQTGTERERERETDRQTDRQTETETERQRQRDRDSERKTERQRDRDSERQTERVNLEGDRRGDSYNLIRRSLKYRRQINHPYLAYREKNLIFLHGISELSHVYLFPLGENMKLYVVSYLANGISG